MWLYVLIWSFFWYFGSVKGIFFSIKGRRLKRSNIDTGNSISVQNLISYSALIDVKELLRHLFCFVLNLKFTANDTAVTMISFSPVYLVVLPWRNNIIQKRVNFGIMKGYSFTFLWQHSPQKVEQWVILIPARPSLPVSVKFLLSLLSLRIICSSSTCPCPVLVLLSSCLSIEPILVQHVLVSPQQVEDWVNALLISRDWETNHVGGVNPVKSNWKIINY